MLWQRFKEWKNADWTETGVRAYKVVAERFGHLVVDRYHEEFDLNSGRWRWVYVFRMHIDMWNRRNLYKGDAFFHVDSLLAKVGNIKIEGKRWNVDTHYDTPTMTEVENGIASATRSGRAR